MVGRSSCMARQSPSRRRWRSPPTVTSIAPSSTQTCSCTRRPAPPVSNATRPPGGKRTSTICMGCGTPGGETLRRRYPEAGSRHAGWRARRATGPPGAWAAAPVASNSEASITPRPAASFSSTTAVGLLSPRSTSEIIDRLNPLLAARASSERPCAARSFPTRSAMRWFRSGAASPMMDTLSIILDTASSPELQLHSDPVRIVDEQGDRPRFHGGRNDRCRRASPGRRGDIGMREDIELLAPDLQHGGPHALRAWLDLPHSWPVQPLVKHPGAPFQSPLEGHTRAHLGRKRVGGIRGQLERGPELRARELDDTRQPSGAGIASDVIGDGTRKWRLGALVGIVPHAGDSPVRFLIDLDPEAPSDGAPLVDEWHLQDDPYKIRQILAVSRRDQTPLITAVDASLALLRRHCEVGVGPPARRLALGVVGLGPADATANP